MGWRNRPISIEHCPEASNYVMFVDENGSSDLKYINKCIQENQEPDINSVYFTVTGCIVHREHLKFIIDTITELKYKYWNEGLYEYKNTIKRVCFHSREIRKKDGPFFMDSDTYNEFIIDLTQFLGSIDTKIISININKHKLCQRYSSPFDPYDISSEFLIERYTKFLLENDSTGTIMLESRGKKEDKQLLEHLKNLISNGTGNNVRKYVHSEDFLESIQGIYFNPKWCTSSDCKKSYYGLEIADLFSHPIHSYVRSNCSVKSQAYEILECKLINYPNYTGFGLKIFP